MHVFDAASGRYIYSLGGPSDPLSSVVAWSPDSRYLATCPSSGFDVHVHNASTGKTIFVYTGHSAEVGSVAWSPDGQLIASASGYDPVGKTDNTVQVWDATTGDHAYIYNGHSRPVTGVTWSPDGKYLASSSVDKTVQVWQAP